MCLLYISPFGTEILKMRILMRYYMYEDELPEGITDAEYNLWYKASTILSGVRVGPVVALMVYSDDIRVLTPVSLLRTV